MSRRPPASNWQSLQRKLRKSHKGKEKKSIEIHETNVVVNESGPSHESKSDSLRRLEKSLRKRVVGLDCEMVGLGDRGKENALARCSIVDFDGRVLYDRIIRPKGYVTDFRTKWSGIKRSDLRKDKENVVTFEECQESVAAILKGKILVGHALQNDLAVLLLSHPRSQIRDTGRYPPYMRRKGATGKLRPRALKDLTLEFLKKKIQTGEHDSVEDARCAVALYRRDMENWENWLLQQKQQRNETSKGQSVGADDSSNLELMEKREEIGIREETNEEPTGDFEAKIDIDSRIDIEELQPRKRSKLSIQHRLKESGSSSIVDQLIQETRKMESFVSHRDHRVQKSTSKRKYSELVKSDSEQEEVRTDSVENVVVFEAPALSAAKKAKEPLKKNQVKKTYSTVQKKPVNGKGFKKLIS